MASLLEITTSSGTLDLLAETDEQFYITKQINDLTSLTTREADFTKQIQIPATDNNIQILFDEANIAGAVGITSNKVQCSILLDGLMIAPRAFLLFTQSDIDNEVTLLTVTILYGNFNLFENILPGDISDINWADFDTPWTPTDVAALGQNETGIVFPLADWYADNYYFNSTINIIDINQAGFWLYTLEILNRIISEAGFTLVPVIVPDDFNDFAICCPVTKYIDPTVFEGVSLRAEVNFDPVSFFSSGGIERVPWTNVVVDLTAVWNAGLFQFDITTATTLTIVVSGTVDFAEGNVNNFPTEIRIFHNANEIDVQLFAGNGVDVPFFMSVQANVLPNDIIYVEIETDNSRLNPAQWATMTIIRSTSFSISTPDNEDRTVHVSEHVPKINKKTFLTSILTQFNLLMVTDGLTKEVFLYSFDAIYTRPEQDWSTFIDVNSPIKQFNAIQGYFQQSILKYIDDDTLRRFDANFIQLFESEILALEGIIIEQPFTICDSSISANAAEQAVSICPLVTTRTESVTSVSSIFTVSGTQFTITDPDSVIDFQVGDYIALAPWGGALSLFARRIIKKTSESTGEVSLAFAQDTNSNNYSIQYREAQQFQPRVAVLRPSTDPFPVLMNLTEGGWIAGNTPPTYVPINIPGKVATPANTLLWSDIAQNGEYKNLFNALETPSRIQAWFNFSVAEFSVVDFTRPVYISHFNAFYYINKIEQYKVNQKVRVDLIRISILNE